MVNSSPIFSSQSHKTFVAVQLWLSHDSAERDHLGKASDIMMHRQQLIIAQDYEDAKHTIIEATELGLMNSIIAGEITPEVVMISLLDINYELAKLQKGITEYEDQPHFKIVTRDVIEALGQ